MTVSDIICKGDVLLGSGCEKCSSCLSQLVTIGRSTMDEIRDGRFQERTAAWMLACFTPEIAADVIERGDRLAEEVFEALQSVDYPQERLAALSNYVYGRPKGEPHQEVGGIMVTLAAWCTAHGVDLHEAGEEELARILQPEIIEKIRAKQKAKPTGSALPVASEHHKLDNDRQVFFYEQDFYVLSNFSAFSVTWAGQWRFDTSEALYHWLKFATGAGTWPRQAIVSDEVKAVAEAIRRASSAHEAFKIAEHNKALRRTDWDDVKVDVMRKILRAKAEQHEYIRRKLLATGDRELIEDSWRDDFWGWGENRDGQNMLGKLWMEIRAELRGAA